VPSGASLVAEASGSVVDVYASPGAATPELTLPNPWLLNGAPNDPITQVFYVLGTSPDGWVHVLLPERPNGSNGWLSPQAARLLVDDYRIDVSLGAHQITVLDDGTSIYSGPVAIGAPATPTPTGLFYLRVLLSTSNVTSAYGPYAYGLSSHSEALTTFEGGDAEIGIHGNNDPSVLGQSVSHGCIRMDNAEITKLAAILPLGTPVDVTA
jgi:lipoprotein-anchoring transpeptidase ErfK/SrfK